jgi:hypothetical protein
MTAIKVRADIAIKQASQQHWRMSAFGARADLRVLVTKLLFDQLAPTVAEDLVSFSGRGFFFGQVVFWPL